MNAPEIFMMSLFATFVTALMMLGVAIGIVNGSMLNPTQLLTGFAAVGIFALGSYALWVSFFKAQKGGSV